MKIKQVFEKQKDEVCKPSWMQRVLCSIFNIDIEKKYQFKITLEIECHPAKISQFFTGHSVKLEGCETLWLIVERSENVLVLRNHKPISDFSIGNELFRHFEIPKE